MTATYITDEEHQQAAEVGMEYAGTSLAKDAVIDAIQDEASLVALDPDGETVDRIAIAELAVTALLKLGVRIPHAE